MPLFDEYIFVDWSASNTATGGVPVADAVWIGRCVGNSPAHTQYAPTRHIGVQAVLGHLLNAARSNRRVLVGFDFPYGYPNGFASILPPIGSPASWERVWSFLNTSITDTNLNVSNRFAVASASNASVQAPGGVGPFWGCPPAAATPHLTSTKPFAFPFQTGHDGVVLNQFRVTESRLRQAGMSTIKSTWQLYGAGSVGSQALTGIARLHQLRHHPELASFSRVWPFETGFTGEVGTGQRPFVLHAEIWPVVGNDRVSQLMAAGQFQIKDQAQVFAMCEWAAQKDENGQLGAELALPPHLADAEADVCVREEGWILGSPAPHIG